MQLHVVDWICIAVYILFIIGLGSSFARQQKSTKSYFLAGKSMSWFPLAASMYATLFSSISYVMGPAEAFRSDMQYFVALLMFPIASIVSIIFFIDFYIRLNITTIYQYIQVRFNKVMSYAILIFYMAFRVLYAGVVMYTLSLVLSVTIGVPLRWTMAVMGICAIFYTTLGGLKAVIWCDVVQFFVLFAGLLSAFIFAICKVPGGFAEIISLAHNAEKLKMFNFQMDIHARYVFWTLIAFGFVEYVGAKTVDQMNVQRYLSARSPRDGKLAMLVTSFFTLPVWILLFGVGKSLYAYYTHFPSETVQGFIDTNAYDRIFPYYIMTVMPVGLRGLMIAALLAASMSTMDSVLNVLSTITTIHFQKPLYKFFKKRPSEDHTSLVSAKFLTVIWGLIIIAVAQGFAEIESILKTINSVTGICIGPVVGVFLLAMFSKKSNWLGSLVGLIVSVAVAIYLKFGTSITFTLYGIVSIFVCVVTGFVFSLLLSRMVEKKDPKKLEKLTWKWYGLKENLFGGQETTTDINKL